LFIQPVRQGGGRRFVDDAQHLEAGDLAGILRGLALAVIEIGGNGNHRLGHRFAQIGLCIPLELLQN
jgi:hypothetical protein